MMNNHIIYVPGLNDAYFPNQQFASLLPLIWQRTNTTIHIVRLHWSEGTSFEPKLQQTLKTIDSLSSIHNKVFLIGQSAGGSAVLNAYCERKTKVNRVINICGRLREGGKIFPSLSIAAIGNPAFKESVLLFENKNAAKLTQKDKEKILIIRPIIDEIVPAETITLDGVKEIVLPIPGHSLGGIATCTIYSKYIFNFIDINK